MVYLKVFLVSTICLLSFSNQSNSWWYNKIKVTDCYDPKETKTQREMRKRNVWEWELDLKKKTAIQTYNALGKINIRKLRIKAKTDRYIAVADPKFGPDIIFDLKKDTYNTEPGRITRKYLGNKKIVLKCNFTKTPF